MSPYSNLGNLMYTLPLNPDILFSAHSKAVYMRKFQFMIRKPLTFVNTGTELLDTDSYLSSR